MLTTRNISLSFLNKRAVEIINKKISSHMKRTSLNLRAAKTIKDNLPKGMDKLTPYGNLVCNQGHDMDYLGVRTKTESG